MSHAAAVSVRTKASIESLDSNLDRAVSGLLVQELTADRLGLPRRVRGTASIS